MDDDGGGLRVVETKLPVRPVGLLPQGPAAKRVYAQDILPHSNHQNVVVVARKGSGKTNLIWDMLTRFVRDAGVTKLRVMIFSPTCEIDPAWVSITEYLAREGVKYFCSPSFYTMDANGRKVNLLQQFKESFKPGTDVLTISIWDDQSFDTRSNEVAKTLISNRHFNMVTIIAAQAPQMLPPVAWSNADFLLLLNGITRKGIDFISERANLDLTEDQLWELYKRETAERYAFLWIKNTGAGQFRRNWDVALSVRKEEEPPRKRARVIAQSGKDGDTTEEGDDDDGVTD